MTTTIKFAKTKPSAIIPSKIEENAGYDIYACFDDDYMIIYPNETVLIPTGIATAFEKDYTLILKERGSTGIKGMRVGAGVIDSGFRGEIFVAINNTNSKAIIISKEFDCIDNLTDDYVVCPYNKAITQAILLPVPNADVEEYTYDELLTIGSDRGVGDLGSSGK